MKTLNIFIYSLSHFLRFSFDSPSYYGECYASFFFFRFQGKLLSWSWSCFSCSWLPCRRDIVTQLSLFFPLSQVAVSRRVT